MVPSARDKILRDPELLASFRAGFQFAGEPFDASGAFRHEEVIEAFTQQILGSAPEEASGRLVHPRDAEPGIEDEDGVHGGFEQGGELFFPSAQFVFCLEAAMLGGGARGEDFEERNGSGILWHGFVVEHRDVPDDGAVRVEQRRAEITDRPQRHEVVVLREQFDEALGDVNQRAVFDDVLAGGSSDGVFIVLDVFPVEPHGERPEAAGFRKVFGHPGAGGAHDGGKVLHQRAEEIHAGFRHGAFDDEPKGGVVGSGVGGRACHCHLTGAVRLPSVAPEPEEQISGGCVGNHLEVTSTVENRLLREGSPGGW